jgi:hypothetical protein
VFRKFPSSHEKPTKLFLVLPKLYHRSAKTDVFELASNRAVSKVVALGGATVESAESPLG